MLENHKVLSGYDTNGVVYDAQNAVFRQVLPAYSSRVRDIVLTYQKFNLSLKGIVQTQVFSDDKNNGYILKHQKHIISYPHEWTISMFKQSLVFHIELFLELEKNGLTLKDALPQNVLFDFCRPVFVDFLSLVKKENLEQETWLKGISSKEQDPQKTIFWSMLFPYFLVPFILMVRKDYAAARNMLFTRACNCGQPKPSWKDLFALQGKFSRLACFTQTLKLFFVLSRQIKKGMVPLNKELLNFVKNCDLTEKHSAYFAYYSQKNEVFDFGHDAHWMPKQKSVFTLLKKYKPETVLDLGANTGWFSMLAAREGARVIATDIDEVAIDILYQQAQRYKLPILSLCLSFTDLVKQQFGVVSRAEEYKDRSFARPLFLPATERLSSDLVLCLALIHHLILGQGLTLAYVIKILAMLSKKVLVLEFVDLDDEKIKEDPCFFKYISQYSHDNYNVDCVMAEGKKYFKKVYIIPSHPNTRTLLVFEK